MDPKGKATASLICGIISVVIFWAGYGAILGLILGIIGTILSGIGFISCVICAGALGALAAAAG